MNAKRKKSFTSKNWYFKNPGYAYFPTYALMRSQKRRGSSAPPTILPRMASLPTPDYLDFGLGPLPPIPASATSEQRGNPLHSLSGIEDLSVISDREKLKMEFIRTKSYATVFAALFIFVLIVAITFLVGLAFLTDGFKHITVEERCKERWTTLSSSNSGKSSKPTISSTNFKSGYRENQESRNEYYSRPIPEPKMPVYPSNPQSPPSNPRDNICLTADCVRIASNILTSMNQKEDPCENFYEFACGGYAAVKQVPESEKKQSVFSEARTRFKYEIRELLDDYDAREEKSDAAKLVYIYYDSCMDDQAQDSLDLMPIFSLFSSVGGWALLQNAKFEEKEFRWENLESHLQTLGIDGLLKLSVKTGLGLTGNSSLVIGSPRLLLGDKDLYLSNLGRNEILQSYRTYMVELLELFGADSEAIEPQINNILNFERGLANITSSLISDVKPVKLNMKTLKDEVDQINWKHLFSGALMGLLPNLNDFLPQIFVDMNYLQKLQNYVSTADPQTVNDYMMWKVLTSFDGYLPQKYRNPHETFNSALHGSTVKQLWEECVSEVAERIPLPLAAIYSKWYLENKKPTGSGIEKLLTDLKVSLQQTLLNADWMDEVTRAAAISKLKQLKIGVDIAKHLPSEQSILQPYSGIRLVGNGYFDNNLALRKALTRHEFKKLKSNVAQVDETGLLSDLNPLHRYLKNEVVIPSGILQFPFFVNDAPNAWNYGSLAMLIAREITHAFDEYGAEFDEIGQRRFWWREETEKFFDSKKQCFVAQYDSKNDPITGKKLDGRRTLRENIADNGAIRAAYAAYNQRILQQSDGLKLPALSNFTDHQLFFISFANVYCESIKVNSAQQLLDSESTSPGQFRVNVPLQNFPAFSQSFSCPIGSFMNPYEKCRIW